MKLNRQILVLALTVVCMLLAGCSKKTPKVYRVGILSGAEPFANIADGFKAKMTELGYIEGKNVIYDLQKTNSDPNAEMCILKKFIADRVDLLFVFPCGTTMTTQKTLRGTKIPIVFAMAGIEGNNLVESISHPGGYMTGVRFPLPENTAKRLEILHELAPKAKRIYIVYDTIYPNTPFAIEAVRTMAASIGLTLVEDKVSTVEEFKLALQKRDNMDDMGIDALFLMPDYLNHSPEGFGAVVNFAKKHKLPIGGGMDFTADGGALFSFVPDNFEQGVLAAVLADKIFRGIPAGTIPVVTPESRLRINYKVIQELGLTVPEGLLSRASEIIR